MEPAEELRYLILAAQRAGNGLLAGALRPLGFTPSQAEVLRVLDEFEPLSLGQLGGLLVCETGSPSRLVAGLVERALVKRVPASDDARAIELRLSPKGRAAIKDIREVEASLSRLITDTLARKDAEAMIRNLRALVKGTPPGEALEHRRLKKRPGKG